MRRYRSRWAVVRHLDGQRRVAKEDIAAFLERHAQRLADQKRAETAAVDKQVTFDFPCLLGDEAADVAGLSEALHA